MHRHERVVEILVALAETAMMKVIEIDDVDAHVAQRLLALRAHECWIVVTIRGPFDVAEFRGDENLIARHFVPHASDQLFGRRTGARRPRDLGRPRRQRRARRGA